MEATQSTFVRSVAGIRRAAVTERDAKGDTELLLGAVSGSIQKELEWEGPLDFKEVDERADFQVLRQKVEKLESVFGTSAAQTLDLKVNLGAQFFTPIYDRWWAVGAGMPLAHMDGSMMVIGDEGFSASGFGVYLESDEEGIVGITPHGASNSSWVSFDHLPNVRSKAGAGAVVFDGNALVLSRQPVLWEVKGANRFDGRTYKPPFADIATPAAPWTFGSVPLAPVLAPIGPGRRLLVWFYLWHLGNNMADRTPFLALVSAKVPFLTVTFGKAPIVK